MTRYKLIEVNTAPLAIDYENIKDMSKNLLLRVKNILDTDEAKECKKIAKLGLSNCPKKAIKLILKRAYSNDEDTRLSITETLLYAFELLTNKYKLNKLSSFLVCLDLLVRLIFGRILLYPKETNKTVESYCKCIMLLHKPGIFFGSSIVIVTMIMLINTPFRIHNFIIGKNYIFLFVTITLMLYSRFTYNEERFIKAAKNF
jgi:hypothetical protein